MAKKKKQDQDSKFKEYDDIRKANDSRINASTQAATQILKAGPREIVECIERKEWTAVQVLEVYIGRTVEAQKKTNCVTEVMFKEAREKAVELDAEFARTGKLRGVLHGVPVSFKDCWDIKDLDSSIGLSKFAEKPATEDAEIVKIVRAAGGIPYVKTNTCQTMMTFECVNPIWGRTSSPHNSKYTCGGSSGGEAALIAMDGSPLGFGSDIGGSLRIPAAYCGIYAFKPTPFRVSLNGHASTLHGFEHVADSAGPMARSVDDLVYACKLTFGKGSSKDVTPMPFRTIDIKPKMRFGYYISDGYVKASPACQRAVRETVKRLTAAGHVCIEISVPEPTRAVEIYAGLLAADGYKTLYKAIGQDPVDSGLFLTTIGPKLPGWIRSLIAFIAQHLFKDNISARSLRSTRTRSVHETWKLVEEREEYKEQFYSKIWNNEKLGLDGIIAPVQALPQAPHGTCKLASFLACGTFLYNLLSLPAGVVPVTRVDPQQDKITPEWSDTHSGNGSRVFQHTLYGKGGLYKPDDAAGLPVSIQVVGRQWEDEKVLQMMSVVDTALGKDRGFGPGSWDNR